MRRLSSCAAMIAAAIAFGGCSFVEDSVVPSLSGENPAQGGQSAPQRVEIPPSPGEVAAQSSASSTANVQSRPIESGSPTGTEVGRKIQAMRAELKRIQAAADQYNNEFRGIRNQTQQSTQRYHATVAAINSRLQVGTTPGNPILIQQWNSAQQQLESVSADVTKTSGLVNQVATESAAAGYLLDTTRAAFNLSGAVEEDHKQLSTLADDVSRSKVAIDRLLSEVTDEITRQSDYLSTERRSLTTLSLAIKNGNMTNVAGRESVVSAAPRTAVSTSAASSGPMDLATRRPLVVIRFDRPDVEYQQALYTAVNRALERRPQAVFDLVAVAPAHGSASQAAASTTTARRNAENVLRSLSKMGLPASRVSMSAMSSAEAQTSEVRLYVR